jgi:hypothetical protein
VFAVSGGRGGARIRLGPTVRRLRCAVPGDGRDDAAGEEQDGERGDEDLPVAPLPAVLAVVDGEVYVHGSSSSVDGVRHCIVG